MPKVHISGIVDAESLGAGGQPSHPIYNPPYPSQGPGFPTHPMAPGGQPPYPSQGPGFPTHPIAPGGPPPGVWIPSFPSNPIYIPIAPPPESGLSPEHPIYVPVYPTHPMAPGGPPPGIWPDVEAIKQAIKQHFTGSLPPATQPVKK